MTLPATYLDLIAAGHGHGLEGRPTAAQATAHRGELGLPTTRPNGRPFWTPARLEAWRDRALADLTSTLLDPTAAHPALDAPRAVLALADTAVRDTWLLRFGRASPATQEHAVIGLAAVAEAAPAELRAPAGTVLALAEWTTGYGDPRARLAWATSNSTHPYRLADLLGGTLDAGISHRDWARLALGSLTETECRHPRTTPRPAPDPADVGQALAERGWAVQVDEQIDLGHTTAWTGTLTHHDRAVAAVTQHGPDHEPVLYWPPGSRHQDTWTTDLAAAHATPAAAVAALDLHSQTTADPLAGASTDRAGLAAAGPPPPAVAPHR